MSLVVTCPGCGSSLRVSDSAAGARGRCRRCGTSVRVPHALSNTALSPPEAQCEHQRAGLAYPSSHSHGEPAADTAAYDIAEVPPPARAERRVIGRTPVEVRSPAERAESSRGRYRHYQRLSLYYGGAGAVLQCSPLLLVAIAESHRAAGSDDPPHAAWVVLVGLLFIIGTGLIFPAFAYHAKSRGHSPLWCLAGVLGAFGLLIVGLLPDRSPK
jgi:predicted Zn finger-like uncharacterized protein